MADIAPFRGIRFDPTRVAASAALAPPYDVIDESERTRLAGLDPHNCVRLILPEGDGDTKYDNAARTLNSWLDSGVLVRDPRPALYRYHQVFSSAELGGRTVTRRGFVAAVRLHRFDERIILPHERTLKGPKVDRLKLMSATGAHFSQIFTMYSDPAGQTDRLFAGAENRDPELDGTTEDGTRHLVWRIDDAETVGQLRRLLAPLSLYIADGHHRYETMVALRDRLREQAGGQLPADSAAEYGAMFLCNMDDPGLVVLPIHRLVVNLESFEVAGFLQALSRWFDIDTVEGAAHSADRVRSALAEAAGSRPTFMMAFPGRDPVRVSLKREVDLASAGLAVDSPVAQLDVSILHTLVLEEVLGIDRAAQEAQSNLQYVKDTARTLDLVAQGQGQIGILMNPTRVAQVKAVADAGEFMPQKSTFFYPKIASGVVFNPVRPDESL